MSRHIEVLILRETPLRSLGVDILALVLLLPAFWFNYHYIGGSDVVDSLILLGVAMKFWAIFQRQKYYTIREAQERLRQLEKGLIDESWDI